MKKIGLLITLSVLASCGKQPSSEISNSSMEPVTANEEVVYVKPQTGIKKVVALNYKFAHFYDDLSVKSHPSQNVLGHKPFFIFLSEDNSMELKFYNTQDIKKVGYLDLGNKFEGFNKNNINSHTLKITDFAEVGEYDDTFTYGKPQLNSFDVDMLNKVFVVETEAGDLPYVSKMKTIFWVECAGGFEFKNKDEYSCEHGKLKFNYKLLEYELNEMI